MFCKSMQQNIYNSLTIQATAQVKRCQLKERTMEWRDGYTYSVYAV